MKLLICDQCGDVFNLSHQIKTCSCGRTKGHYTDNTYAVVNGNGYSLAIGNGSLYQAIAALQKATGNRQDMIDQCKINYCWVRPHEGEGNPHTSVNPSL